MRWCNEIVLRIEEQENVVHVSDPPIYETDIEKNEVKHKLYNPEVPVASDKYIFNYSTKSLRLKVTGH